MMYEVKIGDFQKICQNSMVKMLFSPGFSHFDFVVFYQSGSCSGIRSGLKYIFGKKVFSIKIHPWRLYNNGTESPVCRDCSA